MKTQQSVFAVLICCIILLPSCAGNRIKEPYIGITYKFYSHKPQEIRPNSNYDFSRLQKGYGLLIFSYNLKGFKDINRNETILKKGLRIWEYKFSDKDEETKIISKNMTLYKVYEKVKIPLFFELLPLVKDKTKEIGAKLTFQKNKITYGGRIAASEYENNYIILERFDEDCSQFLTTYSSFLQNIPIDTIFIKASRPFPKVKKPYISKSYYD